MRTLAPCLALFAAVGLTAPRTLGASEVATEASSLEHALSVRISGQTVEANACRARAGCRAETGARFPIPNDADASAGRLAAVELENGRNVVLVDVPLREGVGHWILVLSATPKTTAPKATKTLVGRVDDWQGLEGERHAKVLLADRLPTGTRLRIGDRYENADLCGRPTAWKVAELDPNDMLWNDAPAVSLSDDERSRATPIEALASDEPWPTGSLRVLEGKVASSAASRNRAGATDGDLTTRWAEGRRGEGAGEFLVMSASADVAIDAFDFVLRRADAPATDAIPRRLFVATRSDVFAVTIPEAATTAAPETVFTAKLPASIQTDCVALVLDETHTHGGDARAGVVEMRAHTPFDGQPLEEVVKALDDPARADAVVGLLERNGDRGVEAIVAAYPTLSRDGRRRALDAASGGSPAATAAFYVALVLGLGAGPEFDPALDPTAKIARDRLRANRSSARTALVSAIARTPPSVERVWAARELADIAPEAAIGAILDVLADGSTAPQRPGGQDDVRRGLRASLARAANHERDRARRAVDRALSPDSFGERSLVEKIDLLRAIGPGLGRHADASAALAATLQQDASFRTKYLLLEPAAVLATEGDAQAVSLLRRSLTDESAHLRARAAEVSGPVGVLAGELGTALGDESPRVRRAALAAMTEGGAAMTATVEQEVLRLLQRDRWTFVREEAANALSRRPPSPATDRALIATLGDAPKGVRVAALRALGRRGSTSTAGAILELADAPNESVYVRTAAIRALSDLCHRDAVPFLYKLALRAGYQQLPYDQPLGMAALSALDHIRPADMKERLAPLLARNKIVPPQVRAIARGVLARRAKGCQAR